MLDISHPAAAAQNEAVMGVLRELGVEHIPIVTAWNKIDACAEPEEVGLCSRLHSVLTSFLERGELQGVRGPEEVRGGCSVGKESDHRREGWRPAVPADSGVLVVAGKRQPEEVGDWRRDGVAWVG